MIKHLKEVAAGFSKVFGEMPVGKKAALAMVGVFMLAGILLTAYFAGKKEYSFLYGNLSQEDALSITQKLKERNIPFQLERGGTVISVLDKDVYRLRLEMAGEGIPAGGGVGFEIFDKSMFGMTEFVQKLNLRRALQGELQRTINSISAVRSSRVHIVLPTKTLFETDDSSARASVVLTLKRSQRLTKQQVEGIAHLTASAVERLARSNVTIVDSDGNILSSPAGDDTVSMLSSGQMEYRRTYEKNMEKRLRSMLERVVGIGKAIVRVNAEINFKQEQRTEEIYDPASQVARSEQRLEERSSGAALSAGVMGVKSNLPEGGAKQSREGKPAKSSRVNETINYEINKVIRTVVEPTNIVKKLSVAVLVDGKYTTSQNDKGETLREFRPMNEQEKSGLDRLVRTAIGFDQNRQDSVTIESIQFETLSIMSEIETLAPSATGDTVTAAIKFAGLAIAGILAFLFLVRPVMGWITTSGAEMEELRQFPQTVAQMEEDLVGASKPETEKTFRTRLNEVVGESPEQAAELVRAWLKSR
ncbi:MAG: flagellar M-ring protein [bacterium]|nr:MAG: flagellar M-ring protein [bacterium]